MSAFTFELSKCQFEHVQLRTIANLRNVDDELGVRVAQAMNLDLPSASPAARQVQDLPLSPALRIVGNMKETLRGRSIGIPVHDGSDADEVSAVEQAVEAEGGRSVLIALKIGGVKLSSGNTRKVDGQLAGTPSVFFDAVAIILDEDGARELAIHGSAVQFVMDAFGHLKAIGRSRGAQSLLDNAGIEPDEGITGLGADFINAAQRLYFEREAKVRATP